MYHQQNGLNFIVHPSLSIARVGGKEGPLLGSDNYRVTLNDLLGFHVDTKAGIEYKGTRYGYYDFDGALQSYFDNIRISSVSMTVYVQGLKDCKSFSQAVWRPGEYQTKFCEPLKNEYLRIESFSVSSVSTSGVLELQRKIDELDKQKNAKEATEKKVDDLTAQGWDAVNAKEWQKAISLFNQALALDDDNSNARNGLNHATSGLKDETTKKTDASKTDEGKTTEQTKESDKKAGGGGGGGSGKKTEKKEENADNSSAYSVAPNLAAAYEQAGDALLANGNVQGAVAKYNEAQKVYYSEARAKKIESIGLQQLATGLNELADAIDEAEKRLDPTGKFSWSFIGLTYETAVGSKPFTQYTFDVNMSFLVFAFGLKFGHVTNEIQSYPISKRLFFGATEKIPESVVLQSKGIAMEGLIGLSIPIGKDGGPHFSIRPMFGVSFFTNDPEMKKHKDFTLTDGLEKAKAERLNRYVLGIYYQVPKTTIGIGLNLNYLSQNPHDIGSFFFTDGTELDYHGSNPDYQNATNFYFGKHKEEKYKAFSAGLSFVFGISKKR